jgi:hypothetical protein
MRKNAADLSKIKEITMTLCKPADAQWSNCDLSKGTDQNCQRLVSSGQRVCLWLIFDDFLMHCYIAATSNRRTQRSNHGAASETENRRYSLNGILHSSQTAEISHVKDRGPKTDAMCVYGRQVAIVDSVKEEFMAWGHHTPIVRPKVKL